MSYITKYGSFWGQIPQTSGRVFWVAPAASYTVEGRTYSASDNNDGLSPERAVLTLDYAVGLCTASVGDVIVLLPGAHSWSASVAADVAGITITGLPSGGGHLRRQRTSITTSASDEIINVTAADVEIAYLHIIPVTQKAGIDFTTAADRLNIHDCSIDMYTAAAHTSTKGIAATTVAQAPTDILIERVHALSDGAQGAAVSLGDTFGFTVQDCVFLVRGGAWAAAVDMLGVTSINGYVRRCHFGATLGTMTVGISGSTDDASTGWVGIYDCRFDENVAAPIDNFGVENCNIAENYQASADGSAEGGLLWSSTT
jgi:hypothetical protein